MASKKIAQPEHLFETIASHAADKQVVNVLSFSTKFKAKKITEAKRRVYQAATNLNW